MTEIQNISESELEIMRILWRTSEATLLSPLMDALAQQGRQWKTNTVLTFLARLTEKGLVSAEKVGRRNQYVPLITETEYMASRTRSFIDDVYGGDAKGLVASLVKQERITREDIDALRAYWEEVKGDG